MEDGAAEPFPFIHDSVSLFRSGDYKVAQMVYSPDSTLGPLVFAMVCKMFHPSQMCTFRIADPSTSVGKSNNLIKVYQSDRIEVRVE